jgi:hypothetical protein
VPLAAISDEVVSVPVVPVVVEAVVSVDVPAAGPLVSGVVEAVVSVDVPAVPEAVLSDGVVVEAVVSVDVPVPVVVSEAVLSDGVVVVEAVVSVDVPVSGAEAVAEETVAQSCLTCACCSVLSEDQLDLISSWLLSWVFEASAKKASAIGPDQSLVSSLSASVIIIVSVAPGVAVVAPDVSLVPVVLLCAMALVPSASVSIEAAISLYIMSMNPVCGWSFRPLGARTKPTRLDDVPIFFQKVPDPAPRQGQPQSASFISFLPGRTEHRPPPAVRMGREAKLMKRSWEMTSIIVVAVIAVVMLIAFLWINGGFGTAPVATPGSEHPATRAPADVEPPEPNTPAAEPQ